ncbi:MAG: Methionine-tRNA ligase [Candidatus Kaiserbacteria bacterium GW2011_GWC2_49_12]|uniref:Methionine-tRNA ligase n=1 Tax=Candidatus Kaiserbacteria bacterium GW2011_GWC2_49_12 TaxID=1618675 RepID=A0A0G1VJH7_9BACT|nr:MAG: Methionine-tRNA ligase [Candidatus Kaiserbacteria bacterium GW2011_GWC2_49_12]HCM43393.1 hypothetical protein [Candidatus Kaiserbacteria bacterium]
MEEITYEDFAKLDIRIGTIIAAELVPDTDKLIKCTVDFGDLPAGSGRRTIVSGIAEWKKPDELIGRQLPYVVNLAPRMLRGVESQGMLVAASISARSANATPEIDGGGVVLLEPERSVPPGTKLR